MDERIDLAKLKPAEAKAKGTEKDDVYTIQITGRVPEERNVVVVGAKK